MDWVYSVAFSPDGTQVLTGSWDDTAKLWDAETGQEIHTFPVGGVISVAFSPDGTRVLTGSNDGTARIWHTPDPNIAWDPDPADGATEVARTPTLSWGPGQYATSHDVYFSDSSPPAFIGNQTETSYSPGTLDKSKTCYWRIDEVEADGTTKYEGSVWSFTVKTLGR
jgi:WD40 repeat protein